jgi:hypothetical protein
LFAALVLEWLAATQLQRSTSGPMAATWQHVLTPGSRHWSAVDGPLARPGPGHGVHALELRAWPAVALAGTAVMALVGLLLSRRSTLAVASAEVRLAIAFGIVALIVFNPDLVPSLIVLAAATGLGRWRLTHRAQQFAPQTRAQGG